MDFYVILGVERGASVNDIKRAYRRLARRYHPDINPGDRVAEQIFRQIVEAYETLSDPERRQRYDTGVPEGPAPQSAASWEFQGFDFSRHPAGAAEGTFGDLFAEVFQEPEQRAGRSPQPGTDLHATLAIGLDEAMRGVRREVSVTRLDTCATCRGSGTIVGPDAPCLHCHGEGRLRWGRGHMVFTRPCPRCQGTGTLRSRACPTCGSQGRISRTERVAVDVPAGILDGVQLRVAGRGHVGRRGGRAGDLYVTVRVEPHQWLRREGDDICLVMPVAVHEAALGARVEVPTFDGLAVVRIPPNTPSGHRFRLRGRGVPAATGGRGDLLVEVRLVLPTVLDERSKELLRELGRINTENVRDGWPG